MSATVTSQADSVEPAQLTFRYTRNPDGWVTAQIVEFPAAISQGSTEHEAWINVLEALHDLTHEQTTAERLAFIAQARIVEPLSGLIEPLNGLFRELKTRAARASERDRVH